MPRTEEENQKIREEMKEKIIYKAVELFAKKGLMTTSINDIAKSAEISVGLMYRYFKSKQELFETIVNIALEGLSEVIQIFNNDLDPKILLEIVCQEMINELDSNDFINLNMMIIQGLTLENDPLYDKIMEQDKKMFEAVAKVIKRGQDMGIFSSGDPMAKSTLYFSFIQGLVSMKFFFKESFIKPRVNEVLSFLYVENKE